MPRIWRREKNNFLWCCRVSLEGPVHSLYYSRRPHTTIELTCAATFHGLPRNGVATFSKAKLKQDAIYLCTPLNPHAVCVKRSLHTSTFPSLRIFASENETRVNPIESVPKRPDDEALFCRVHDETITAPLTPRLRWQL